MRGIRRSEVRFLKGGSGCFFVAGSRQDEKTFRYFVFSIISPGCLPHRNGCHCDEFLCLFICLFVFFFKKDVFRLVKSVGQDKYLQILRSDALQFRGIILWWHRPAEALDVKKKTWCTRKNNLIHFYSLLLKFTRASTNLDSSNRSRYWCRSCCRYSYFNLRCRIKASSLKDKTEGEYGILMNNYQQN